MKNNIDIVSELEKKKIIIDQMIQKYIPKIIDEKYLYFVHGKPRYKYNLEAHQKALIDPLWNLLDRGGKRWRPALFLLIAEALGGDPDKVNDFVTIPEVIHNATLIHDDIEDRSELRRGKPCIHKIYGEDVAINVGDEFYFIPMLPVIKNKHKFSETTLIKIYETYLQEMINITYGQAIDIAWHNGICNANDIS